MTSPSGLADSVRVRDADQRVVPGRIQVEDLAEKRNRGFPVAEFLVLQCEVEHRRHVVRVDRKRPLQQQLRRRIAPQFGLDDGHVRQDFLRMVDLQVERGLMLLERFLEASATPQEAGEVESRHARAPAARR